MGLVGKEWPKQSHLGCQEMIALCLRIVSWGARSEAGTSSAADAFALGKAPPCENFQDLVPFEFLEEAHQKFYNCLSRSAIADMHESLTAKKNAIKDLIVRNLAPIDLEIKRLCPHK